ncbi:MAG: GspE/PulE family protein [Thiomonas sp.]
MTTIPPPLPVAHDDRTIQAMAAQLGLPFIDLYRAEPDPAAWHLLPAEFCARRLALPLAATAHSVRLAVVDPFDPETPKLVQFLTGKQVDLALAERSAMLSAINRVYGIKPQEDALAALDLDAISSDEPSDGSDVSIEAQGPIVQLAQYILTGAIQRRASDIHIRPEEDHVALIYRIDGSLVPVRLLPKRLNAPLLRRIKILGKMDVAETRLPQDGQIALKNVDGALDLRISVIPTIHGESAAIRLLSNSVQQRELGTAGFSASDLQFLRETLLRSSGMILVTGPTGSGKSTTLYAMLAAIQQRNVNIITVENPPEYHIAGVQQIPINDDIGLTFARALRNILRHDPDVIMVGEIRDAETAKIAVESALTGHLMLSTLHANSAAATVARLLEMGIEPFLLRSTLLVVLAQRLVRLNCPHCLVEEPVDARTRAQLDLSPQEKFFKGAGCTQCNGTGISGRRMVYELLRVTQAQRALIMPHPDEDAIAQQAVADGMLPLTRHAIELARQHLISLEEAYLTRLI